MTKSDLPEVREAYEEARRSFEARGVECHLISAAAHDGVDALMERLARLLDTEQAAQTAQTAQSAQSAQSAEGKQGQAPDGEAE